MSCLSTYCYNLSGAMSVWPDFLFTRIWRMGGKYYGIASDGIYELTGDDGCTAHITTSENIMGTTNLKRVPYMRVDATTACTGSILYDGGAVKSQPSEFTSARRVKTGRGAKGQGIAVDIQSNKAGFELHSVELYEEKLSRGVY